MTPQQLAEAIRNRKLEERPEPTVGEIVQAFLEHSRTRCSVRTLEDRCYMIGGDFNKVFGSFRTSELIAEDLERWIDSHSRWGPWSKYRANRHVQACFNFAVRKHVISANPFRGVSYPQGEAGQPMSEEHFQLLIRAAPEPFRNVLRFLRLTGARPCEAAILEWDMIDPERSLVSIPPQLHKTGRKTKAPRIIMLAKETIELLARVHDHVSLKAGLDQPLHPRVFLNSRGRPWTRGSLDLRVYRMREKLGIPKAVKLYGLRHRYGTDSIVRGNGLVTTGVLMGHTAGSRVTERYLHVREEIGHLQQAVERAVTNGNGAQQRASGRGVPA